MNEATYEEVSEVTVGEGAVNEEGSPVEGRFSKLAVPKEKRVLLSESTAETYPVNASLTFRGGVGG